MADKFNTEIELYQRVARFLTEGRQIADAFREASLEVPGPLKRLLDEEVKEEEKRKSGQLALIPPIQREKTPPEAASDWISVPAHSSTPASVTLAVLRVQRGPMKAGDVKRAVLELLPNSSEGAISNVGTRYKGELIGFTPEGWVLLAPDRVPLLLDGFLWGPKSAFQKQELAAHRREAILLVLEHYETGLQIVQIVEQLKGLGWIQAPINKDLVKADVFELQKDGKIRRRGNSGKWELGREER